MSNSYLEELTQQVLDEYFAAFYNLDGRAGINKAEVMKLQEIQQCIEECQ